LLLDLVFCDAESYSAEAIVTFLTSEEVFGATQRSIEGGQVLPLFIALVEELLTWVIVPAVQFGWPSMALRLVHACFEVNLEVSEWSLVCPPAEGQSLRGREALVFVMILLEAGSALVLIELVIVEDHDVVDGAVTV